VLLASLKNPKLTAEQIATASIDELHIWNGKAGGDYILRVIQTTKYPYKRVTIARKPNEEDTSPSSPTDTADPVEPETSDPADPTMGEPETSERP
jgi:hypothetical protein